MSFQNLQQIRESFGLSNNDPEGIRRELRLRMKKIHPDTKSAESPQLGTEKEEVLRITAALSFLDDARKETAVVPVAEVTALVQALKDLVPDSREKDRETRLSQQIDAKIEEAKSTGRLPKIILTVLAALLTVVWLFPGITANHPVMSKYINVENPVFNIIWLALILYTGAIWLVFKLWGDRQAGSKKNLGLELTQNRLFDSFVISKGEQQGAATETGFYKDQFVSHIVGGGAGTSTVSSLLRGRPRPVDEELAQSLADTILFRAEKKGIIKKKEGKSLREYYLLTIEPKDL